MADVPGDLAAELKAKGRGDLHSSPAFGTAFLTLMCTPKLPAELGQGLNPLADVRVRQALAMAIDKRFIVDNITRMDQLPARTYLPPDGTLPDFQWLAGPYDRGPGRRYTDTELRQLLVGQAIAAGPGLPYDVARARQLLADAGYPSGRGFPVLPILYNTDNTTRGAIVQHLKNQWKQTLNIDVDIQALEGKIFSRQVSTKQYAIATVAWYGDYPDASTFTDKYLSTSLQNDSLWTNQRYDDLCHAAQKEPDARRRLAILSEAENMIDTQVPIVPLYHYVNLSLSRDGVHGCDPNPRNMQMLKSVWVDRK
jgi:oligopeptide transport system substrate-binding protein